MITHIKGGGAKGRKSREDYSYKTTGKALEKKKNKKKKNGRANCSKPGGSG